jgi:hypothetical protein
MNPAQLPGGAERVSEKRCDVCGSPAEGACRVDAADGPMLGYLCDWHAADMAALLDDWRPFPEDPS